MDQCRYGSSCWRPLCPYVHASRRARRWAELWTLFASQEEEDDLEVVKVISVEAVSERFTEQNADVVLPIVDVPVPLAQPCDQARPVSADTVHQQGYCCAYFDIATSPSASNCCEDSGSRKDAVHRQFCGRPCDLAATGSSDSNCDEDGGSLPHAVPLCSLEDLQRMMREANTELSAHFVFT